MQDITNQHKGLMRGLTALCEGCDTHAVMTTLLRFAAAKCLENGAEYYAFSIKHPAEECLLNVVLSVQEDDEDEYDD